MKIEYVPRKEYSQRNRQFCEEYLPDLRRHLKETMGLKFQSMLAGSGRTKLVTRTPNGGVDLDYLFLFTPKAASDADPEMIKNKIMDKLRELIVNTHVEDSSSAITVRFTDPDRSSRIFGIDIVIGYTDSNGLKILKHDKHRGEFIFNPVEDSSELRRKAHELHRRGRWNEVRKEYLKLKQNGKHDELCSYQVYNMAVNNVYSQI